MTVCETCSASPASLAITHIHDGVVTTVMLCAECASLPFGAHPGSLLATMLGSGEAPAPLACPRCGLEFAAFAQTQLLGCAACYAAFSSRVDPMIEHIHFAGGHVGKSPPPLGGGGD